MSKRIITRNTHELQVGDTVATHGSLFELTERFSSTDGCVWFHTRYLGKAYDDAFEPVVERNWHHDWTVQGNERAQWSVIAN